MYDSFVETLGEQAAIDFYIYNNDFGLFRKLVQNRREGYTHNVIIPHFLEGGEKAFEVINEINEGELILLDKQIAGIKRNYGAVYENFEKDIFEPIIKVRAMENTVWLAYCNLAGEEGGLTYWGGSCVIGPGNPKTKVPGEPILSKAPYDVESLTVADIDYSLNKIFRPYFPVLRDIPQKIYGELSEQSRLLG